MEKPDDISGKLVDRRTVLWHAGEDFAAAMLEGNGYTIVERNWRAGRYEIDIIALDKQKVIVFVEIKTRITSAEPGVSMYGLESITHTKRQKLVVAANIYLHDNNLLDRGGRLDVIVVNYKRRQNLHPIDAADLQFMKKHSLLESLEDPVATHIKQAFC
ncbi:MAG TPA: YraN family protein [Drouetiella sp.]